MWRAPCVALLALAGIAIGVLSRIALADLIATLIASASIGLMVDRLDDRRNILLACLFVGSAADGALARDRVLVSPLQTWFDAFAPGDRAPEAVLVQGSLVTDASPLDAGVRLLIDVDRVRADAKWHPVTGRLQALVAGNLAGSQSNEWTAGRVLTAPVQVRRPQVWRNPGGSSERWQDLRRTIDLSGTIKSAALVNVEPGHWWNESAALARRRVREASARYVAPHSRQSAAIVAAILIGDRAGLDDDVQRRLQAAGTYHVIAISGGNVALLTAVCFGILRLGCRSYRTVSSVTIAIVVWYGWLVGGQPSVLRAVTAACIYLGLGLVGLRPRGPNVLATTAVLIAMADPLTILDSGAWLSFGATLGIMLCTGRFVRWATAGRSAERHLASWARGLWLIVLGLFGATLAAELILLPISIQLFGRVSLLGLVLNFVAIPAMAVVQLSGLITTALAGWWPSGAGVAGRTADVAASLLIESSRVVDSAPWMVWRVPPSTLVWTATFYVAFGVFLTGRGWQWPRWLAAAGLAASLAIIVTAPGTSLARPAPGRLRVTMIDVGQGDSVLVQFPGGRSLLVDAGGGPGAFDLGARVVTPALWASGVRRLDWLAITHADIDHIGGALAIEHDFQPREIWEGIPVPPNPERRALRAAAEADHVVWRQLLSGHHFEVGSVAVDVLHPPAAEWERQRVRNDDSLVLRIQFGDVELLLTGDVGPEFEDRIVPQEPAHPLRLLKVAHHGSRSSSSMRFLGRLQPQIAFVSAGRGNLFGHPAPDILARYSDLGTIVFRTDQDGAIVIDTDGRDVDVRTISGRKWKVTVQRAP
jgi:competence protein ComEC